MKLPFLNNKSENDQINPKPGAIRPIVLLSLDGFGNAPPSDGNAVTQADTPHFDQWKTEYPYGWLIASGESVGLPANEEGNSEVGHLTMGAGKAVLQSLERINHSIDDFTFFENQAILSAINHIKTNNSRLHIMGMVGSGEVHSSMKHFDALVEFCVKKEIENVAFHLFTDGRDSPPQEGKTVITNIASNLDRLGVGKIATVSGRYYAMDRDLRWERIKLAYDAIVLGRGVGVRTPFEPLDNTYSQEKSDEFVVPSVVLNQEGRPTATVNDNDAVIFFNFRIDRPRELTMAFVLKDFENLAGFEFGHDPYKHETKMKSEHDVVKGPTFKREKVPKNIFFLTMTEYQEKLPVSAIAFPPDIVNDSLPRIISNNKLRQIRIAESEKERMVTYYFNGMIDINFPGEEVVIVPSPKVPTYDKKPEMSMFEVVEQFKKAVSSSKYHFIMMNFAPPDMVGHTGNMKAAIKAVEFTDKATAEVADLVLAYGGTLIITADHGNVEEMQKFQNKNFYYTTEKGDVDTSHSNNPVPVYIISNELRGVHRRLSGSLSDIAPTILAIMKLPVPQGMTGKNLLSEEAQTNHVQEVMEAKKKETDGSYLVGPSWLKNSNASN